MDTLQSYAYQAAVGSGIDPNVFLWQIGQESSWNPSATNGNAVGIAQFMPGTAAQFGIDPTNPYQSLSAAAQYDSQLLSQCNGDYMCMLNHYGTTANVPASVTTAAANVIAGISPTVGQSYSPGTGQTQSTNNCSWYDLPCMFGVWFANWSHRIVSIILGLIFLAGAIYLYKNR